MAYKENCGELADESFILKEITWKIPNVLSFPRQVDYEVRSPEFSFANGTWILGMYPSGQTKCESEEFVDFAAYRLQSAEAQQDVYFKIFIKNCRGKEFEAFRCFHSFTSVDEEDNGVGVNFMTFSKLVAMKKTLAPGGTLTVVFQMRIKSTAGVMETTSQGQAAGPVKTDRMAKIAPKDCTKTIEAFTQTEADTDFLSQKLSTTATPDKKFVRDYQQLLSSRDGCDVTLMVKGLKFEAHRVILRARSSVFASMFRHDMKEKNTGQIDIVDCDPEYFPDFLRFLYSGCVDSVTSQNVCSLYRAADKYDVQDLKSECLAFMSSHLDVENFCDILTVSLQHSESELIKRATHFFVENAKKIIFTVKWQVFLAEHPTESNELFAKALGADKN